MKQLIQIIMVAIAAIGTVALIIVADIQTRATVNVITQQAQPKREQYRAPEWVVNDRGQRCIKQGSAVTCG